MIKVSTNHVNTIHFLQMKRKCKILKNFPLDKMGFKLTKKLVLKWIPSVEFFSGF